MNKYWHQIIKGLTGTLLLLLILPSVSFGQNRVQESRIYEIQQEFLRGEIDVNTAALEQLRILHHKSEAKSVEQGFYKCATPATMFLENYRNQLSEDVLVKIESFKSEKEASRNKLATQTYISPSGKFQIVYEIIGEDSVSITDNDNNGVPDYVDLVAESADSSYRHEVVNLGFKDPIPEGTTYRIELRDLSYYGETAPQSGSGPGTYITVENDFENFPPNTHPAGHQVGAVYATVAHEFKHAIQYAQNRLRAPSGSIDWAEMDATLFEEVVYDDVNDYYNYIKNGFNSSEPYSESIFFAPQNSTPGAYYHVSWMIYFSEFFGDEIFRDVWALIEEDNFLSIDNALREVLPERQTEFASAFTQNHLWHFASGSRSGQDDYGFGEKELYPNANMDQSFTGVPIEDVEMNSIRPLAARYFEVTPTTGDNGYIDIAVDFDSSQVGIGLLFYMDNGEMKEVIAFGENKSQVYVPTEISWEDIEKLGVVIANYSNSVSTRNVFLLMGKNGNSITIRDPEYADLPKSIKVYQNYPNPFNPITNIAFELPRASFVQLEVYDITGRKVQTLADRFFRLGSYSIPFNSRGLSSGVYIYRLSIDGAVFTKKMTLVK